MKHVKGSSLYGRLLSLPPNISQGWKVDATDKHSSLLRKLVIYGWEKFYDIGHRRPRRKSDMECHRIFKRNKNGNNALQLVFDREMLFPGLNTARSPLQKHYKYLFFSFFSLFSANDQVAMPKPTHVGSLLIIFQI